MRSGSSNTASGANWVAMSVSAPAASVQPIPSSTCLVECASLKMRPQKNRANPGRSERHACWLYEAQPACVASSSVKEKAERSGSGLPRDQSAGAISTAPFTLPPYSAASRQASTPPIETPQRTARRVSVASITASTSSACCCCVYALGSLGPSDRPVPRPSTVITRYRRASTGICAFQCMESAIAQVGSSTTVDGFSWP